MKSAGLNQTTSTWSSSSVSEQGVKSSPDYGACFPLCQYGGAGIIAGLHSASINVIVLFPASERERAAKV